MSYFLTEKGESAVDAYIAELAAKRKEILDAKLDTADDTHLPDREDIIADVNFDGLDEDDEYINGWGVTDHYDSDNPLSLRLGEDLIETFDPCEETLKIWIEDFQKENRDVKEEIDDIKGTISNERLWQKGSSSREEEDMHEQNIADLMAYLKWLEVQANLAEKKTFVVEQIEKQAGNSHIAKDLSDEYFVHTYRAIKDYGMDVYEADKWAWLNTLFGYDIGADRAMAIITWYDDNGMDVLDLEADDKDSLRNVAEMELGFHFNYSAFPDETPDVISYEWPDRL